MRYLSFVLALLALVSTAQAFELPVDQEIAALRWKANYLNTIKETLLANKCEIEVDKNTVALDAGAIRSEGLVMAIGPSFPGNYLAYHKAPKPEFLERVVESTIKKSGAGKNALIVTVQLQYNPEGTIATGMLVSTAEPRLIPEDLWMYEKATTKLALPLSSTPVEAQFKSAQGKAVAVRCH